jgi:hypothetical protein
VQKSAMESNEIIGTITMARLLVCLRRRIPILGLPAHPRRGGAVVVCCLPVLLMGI